MKLGLIWFLLLKQSFVRDLEYRVAFFLGVLGSLAWIALNLITLELIFSQTNSLAGWNKGAVFLLFGTYRLIDALYAMFVRVNLYDLITFVHTGELDLYLTKPLPPRFFLTLRRWNFFDFPNVLASLLIIVYAGQQLGLGLSVTSLSLFLVTVLAGLVILVSIGTGVTSLIFWFQGTANLNDIYRSLLVAARIPVGIFREPLRQIFTLIIPLAFLGTFPAQVFQGVTPVKLTMASILMAGWLLVSSQLIWNRALRAYSSASS